MDCGVKEAAVDNNNLKNHVKKVTKLERFKSLSSAGSWESEEDCPPLASEDSAIGDHVEFESFSGTECSLAESQGCQTVGTAPRGGLLRRLQRWKDA